MPSVALLSVPRAAKLLTGPDVYANPLWRRLRKQAFIRDKGLCCKCGKPVKTNGSNFDPLYHECDHIVSIQDDPDRAFDLDNLQTLHRQCHRAKTNDQQSNRMQRTDGW